MDLGSYFTWGGETRHVHSVKLYVEFKFHMVELFGIVRQTSVPPVQ